MFDLWSIDDGNRILESNDEALVRSVVRELLEIGWSADNLSLGLPDDATVLDGRELVDWLERAILSPDAQSSRSQCGGARAM